MRTTYHSKKVPPSTGIYDRTFSASPRIWTTVVSPQTGKKYGVMIEDKCGELAVYGPTFTWPTIRSIIRESQGYLDPLAIAYAQQKINDRYCGMEC